MPKPILVPIDGSEHARKALDIAVQLARAASAPLHLLHVTDSPVDDDVGMLAGTQGQPLTEERRQELAQSDVPQARQVFEHARRGVDMTGLAVDEVIRHGRAAEAIVDEAKALDAGVVVLGCRGLSDWKGAVMGSVSHEVAHSAPCTVVTVT
ncbi:universal stress protein [Billgrantia sp. LNSP4103-1]|uniref:universal stress protein n=1 Tax=Billgrantia sp. LNSP4103-1 TaxID=3410266 RepID=UPI00403EFA29